VRTRRLGSVLLLVFALVLGACDDGPTDPQASVRGTYQLQDIDGAALPATLFETVDGELQITSGTMVLRSDNSYVETLELRAVYDDGTTETATNIENGTYSLAGGTVTFTVPASLTTEGYSYSGEVSGRTLSYDAGGAILTFRRQ
jgi:hypothetical protein